VSSRTAIGTEEAYRTVEEAAGIKSPNHPFRRELARCIKNWSAYPRYDVTNVRSAAILRAVERLSADARRLLNTLMSTTEEEDAAYGFVGVMSGSPGKIGELIDRLHWLIDVLEKILKITPEDKGGRPREERRDLLIWDLAEIYEKGKGKKAGISRRDGYGGPFFRFVKESRDRCDLLLPRNDDALGRALERSLARRRERFEQSQKPYLKA
jgi:hypothetical protein